MVMKKVEPGIWKPEKEGDKINGIFVSRETDVGDFKSVIYHLEVEKNPMSVWGSAGLNPKMIGIEAGDKIEIVYLGTTPSKKGADTKLYDVFIDDGTEEQTEEVTEEVEVVRPGE